MPAAILPAHAGRHVLLLVLLGIALALALPLGSSADAAFSGGFCGTNSNPVHLQSGNACIHGGRHDRYTMVYGGSVGTAYTRIGISTSSGAVKPNSAGTATSACGGCSIALQWSGGGGYGPAGYAFLHNHSTFASDFAGWIAGS